MIVQRTEIHIIKESNPVYNWILEECLRSRNLYNRVLYVYRQAFTGKHDNIPEFKDIINRLNLMIPYGLKPGRLTPASSATPGRSAP